jgi:hypothetical protein
MEGSSRVKEEMTRPDDYQPRYPEDMDKVELEAAFYALWRQHSALKKKQRAHIDNIKHMQTRIETMKLKLLWMQELAGISLDALKKQKEMI